MKKWGAKRVGGQVGGKLRTPQGGGGYFVPLGGIQEGGREGGAFRCDAGAQKLCPGLPRVPKTGQREGLLDWRHDHADVELA